MTAHGTRRGYRADRCRCDDCRAWKSADWRRYVDSMKRRGIVRPNGWGAYNAVREG